MLQVKALPRVFRSRGQGEVVHVRDGSDRMVEAVAVLPAVAQDLVVLQPADRMLDPRTDPAMLRVVGFLAGRVVCGAGRPDRC